MDDKSVGGDCSFHPALLYKDVYLGRTLKALSLELSSGPMTIQHHLMLHFDATTRLASLAR